MKQTLALFDFDGTITTKDSLIDFIRFAKGDMRTLQGMLLLSPMLAAFKLKLIPNHRAKERMLSHFFKGMPEEEFKELTRIYSLTRIEQILRPGAMERIAQHKAQGDRIVIVSASIECWLKPWCDSHEIELLSTKMTVKKGRINGRFDGRNCHGREKVRRVRELLDLDDFEKIYAYGDSSGDKELLALADKRFYKPFR